jgi:4-amino-4-deoxy-L-arabinose transferase-like glycosyltransferase
VAGLGCGVPRRTWAAVLLLAGLAALARGAAFAGLELYSDEAYYWLWSTRPAAGYFDHPPGVAWLVWLSSRMWPGELGVRLLFVLLGGLTVLFSALTARELSADGRAPLYAALLAAGAPMLHVAGAMALPDGPVSAAYAAALWLLARARGPRWLWAGVAVGCALLAKFNAALLAPALLLLVAWDRELREDLRTPWPWLGAAVAVAVFSPNLVWNARRDWQAIAFQLRHGFRTGATLASFAEYLAAQVASAGPVAMALGVWLGLRARTSPERRVAAATLLPQAVTLYSATRGSAEVNWAVHLHPGLAALAAAWLARRPARLGASLAGAQLALGAAALLLFAVELRRPRLLAGSVAVARFHAGRGLGQKARAAASEACQAAGSAAGCEHGAFVYPSSYQHAGHLAYYAGWTRFGPADERPSQLDLWDLRPGAGEPFYFVGQFEGPGPRFRAGVRASGEGPTTSFEVTFAGQVTRTGTVTRFSRYEGGQVRRPP